MYEPIDIYIEFRRAQSSASNRGFRIPKDFEAHLNKKMPKKNREALILATNFFNTKWMNVNPYNYFECGFELLKSFTYIQFFDQRVMNLYKTKDKNHKREMEIDKDDLKGSIEFVKNWISKYEDDILDLRGYCSLREGGRSKVVDHYLQNKVDKYFVVYMINKGYLRLTDEDRALIPYIVDQYRECLIKLKEMVEGSELVTKYNRLKMEVPAGECGLQKNSPR